MSPAPKRRFGEPSRSANTHPYNKPEVRSSPKAQAKQVAQEYVYNANQAALESAPAVCATQAGPPAVPSAPSDANQVTLKIEPTDVQEAVVRAFQSDIYLQQAPLETHLEDQLGMPTRAQWNALMDKYLTNLHPSKREKALISENMHKMIYQTLIEPDVVRIGTPQFRFWCRKMFQVVDANGALVITNGGRPIAVKEYIYDILCMCHEESGHSGRDKTCKILRDYYTWIPKELTASFVKACPTCIIKRSTDSFVPRRRQSLIKTAVTMQVNLYENNRPLAGSAHYSVQHVNEFAESLYTMPGHPGDFVPKHEDSVQEHERLLGSPLSPNLASARLYQPDQLSAEASCTYDYTLPPLNARNHSGAVIKHDPSLPPLLKYLSHSSPKDDTGPMTAVHSSLSSQLCIPRRYSVHSDHNLSSESASVSTLQLDPLLLAESQRSAQTPLYPTLASCGSSGSVVSLGGCGRSRTFEHYLAAETECTDADRTLCDDSAQVQSPFKLCKDVDLSSPPGGVRDTPLYSPRPVKVEDTAAMIQLANIIASAEVGA